MKHISSLFNYHLILLMICFGLTITLNSQQEVDARSSATSLAVRKSFPSDISLNIFGKVKKTYHLKSDYLSTLATVRIRTREVDSAGEIMGVYIYHGIPLYFLLDGIEPHKEPCDSFDRPLDLIVTFISQTGKKSHFSYGELTMCDDSDPITLAFYREQLLPSKDPDKYKKNRYTRPLSGLRLICPQDKYDNRYLDQVVSIKFSLSKTSNALLPGQTKGEKCRSEKLFYIREGKKFECLFKGIPLKTFDNWFRIGHGRGIKSKHFDTVTGYCLRSFLIKYFGAGGLNDFYIFVGCDGYRSIFSWSEIFQTSKGEKMILITSRNGEITENGITLGPVGDFFVDRDIWGLAFVEKVIISEK